MIIKMENNRRCEIFLAESFAIFVDQTVSVCFGLSMTHDAQMRWKKFLFHGYNFFSIIFIPLIIFILVRNLGQSTNPTLVHKEGFG